MLSSFQGEVGKRGKKVVGRRSQIVRPERSAATSTSHHDKPKGNRVFASMGLQFVQGAAADRTTRERNKQPTGSFGLESRAESFPD